MSYQVLARKWRPKKFQEVIGQEHIARSLQNAIVSGNIGHAYIFTGTRGIGKTSIARIFAKSLRCSNILADGNPCGECTPCWEFNTGSSLNVLEIDGASNNSVEDIRTLIGNIHYLPTTGNKKVYIIDEVHMLSLSAFNALLKTLEEPPEHVIFLFATTEPQKLPSTILSRFQRFDFRNVSIFQLQAHLKMIFSNEGIEFSSDRELEIICELGNGSVRDTLSLVDQVLSYSDDKKITSDVLARSLGIANEQSVHQVVQHILNHDMDSSSDLYQKLLEENVEVKNIAYGILNHLYADIQKKLTSTSREDESGRENQKNLSISELIWIYESLSKDFSWALESIDPSKMVKVIIQKIALRRQMLGDPVVAPDSPKKKELIQEPHEPLESNLEKINSKYEKNWDGFLEFLRVKSPASAANLEQGNILEPIRFEGEKVFVKLGFSKSARVFFDYLNGPEVYKRLKESMSFFFAVGVENVEFFLEAIVDEIATGFKSKVEIFQQKQKELEINQEKEIKSNPLLLEAEKIFGSTIDKIILNKDI